MAKLSHQLERLHYRNVSTALAHERDMTDVAPADGEDFPTKTSQPSTSFTSRFTRIPAYRAVPQSSRIPSKTITSEEIEEIELTGNHRSSSHQRRSFSAIDLSRNGYGGFRRPTWLRRRFWVETWSDVKEFPYSWLVRRFFSHFLPFSVIIGLLVLFAFMSRSPQIFTNDTSGDLCKPDGSFMLSFNPYSPWRRDSVFSINVNFGSYSFGIAKLIDVCWDVGVGRGGQALGAIISYKVLTQGLSSAMETSSVTYDTFKAVTLHPNSMSGIIILVRDFFRNSGRRARTATFWIIFSGLFVLIVPTWLSAMTGYSAIITAYVNDNNDTLISAVSFTPIIYTIYDGERIGLGFQNNTQISVPWGYYGIELDEFNYYGCSPDDNVESMNVTQNITFSTTNDLRCKLLWAVSKYVSDYGFLGNSTALNTTFYRPDNSNVTTSVHISPSLNISAHFTLLPTADWPGIENQYPWSEMPYGQYWQNPIDGQHTFNVSAPIFWDSVSQTTYNLTELNKAGSCQQDGNVKYKWGFSFLLSYIFLLLFLLWTIGTWVFYLDSWLHSRLDTSRSKMGVERAILDLSESMLTKLDSDQVQLRDNSRLQPLVKDTMLTYSTLPLDLPTVTRWTKFQWWRRDFVFTKWAKDERWWLGAMFVFTLMLCLSWIPATNVGYVWNPFVAGVPVVGIFSVFAAGRETRSRWVPFAFCLLVFVLLSFALGDYNYSHGND